jgi:hypothetical protein
MLTEEDLKELGMKMGTRKLVTRWIQAHNGTLTAASTMVTPMSSPSPSATPVRASASASAPITPAGPSDVCYLYVIFCCVYYIPNGNFLPTSRLQGLRQSIYDRAFQWIVGQKTR